MMAATRPKYDRRPHCDLAIVGGTGLYSWGGLEDVERLAVDTPWGAPSSHLVYGRWQGRRLLFLARHGERHDVAPHAVNYRANIWALQKLGARRVIGINAVGGIRSDMAPQVLALPEQIIDYTWGRQSTYQEGAGPVIHAEFAEPYSATLRTAVLLAAAKSGVSLVAGGCYGATQGPRLETRAEIARMRRDGCDMVGMTGMPEAALARELGLEYACVAVVANWAAGCGDEGEITIQQVTANVAATSAVLPRLVAALCAEVPV